jgi:arylsulfatase A-like enzyme
MISTWSARILLAVNGAVSVAGLQAAERPNIVLIISDDQGIGDVSCYGGDIPTPHIDSIARLGIRFDNGYVAAPACTPSRYAMLTGRYPNRSQDRLVSALMFLQERDADRGIRPEATTIAELLQKRGYRTALVGKWHLGHGSPSFLPTCHGFEQFYGTSGGCVDYFTKCYGIKPDWYRGEARIQEEGYATDLITNEAVRFLQAQRRGRPFFLHLAYTAPHYGKGWDPKQEKTTNILQAKKSDLARFSHIEDERRRTYAAMVASMDDGIGRVLDALRRSGLERDTLVIFISDNGGDPRYGGSNGRLRGRKGTVFEGGIRVPFLMRWPGRIKPASVSRQVACGVDLFPTLCHLVGIGTKGLELDGVDLTPALLEGREVDRSLFWACHGGAFRQGPWKYVRTRDGNEMLFNLDQDPYEQTNLAEVKPEMFADLKARHAAVVATFEPPPTQPYGAERVGSAPAKR